MSLIKKRKMQKPKFAFFGTPDIAVTALEEMATFGHLPSLVVCNPDAPVGRKQVITPPPVKVWAQAHDLPVFQPHSLKDHSVLTPLTSTQFDFFVVLAYGKIMPQWLIDLPAYGTINAHPSLLPKFRGASPIRSTLLHDLSACGVTIMQMDAKLDHGPILLQEAHPLSTPIPGQELDFILAKKCGQLLSTVIQQLTAGYIQPKPQDDTQATFCTKITKDMAELVLDPHHLPIGEEALSMYRKICAFDGWPGAFFFHGGKRIKITDAAYDPATKNLTITRIIPEGKKEVDFTTFLQSL